MIPAPSILRAVFWMALSILSFLAMTIASRETTEVLDVFEVLELRSLVGLLILMPLVLASGGFRAMRTNRPWMHIGRNVSHFAGQAAWLYALTLIPLAVLVAIEFTTPIWTAVLAVTFLGEKMNKARVVAVVLGLVGVTVIVRPGVGSFSIGEFIVLGAAVSFGISMVMVKSMTRTESVVQIIFWMLVIQSVLGLLPALYVWKNPPLELWPWIVVVGFSGMSSHFCLARALTYADATLVSPMDFLRVPATALVGWALYSEQLDLFTAAGAALVLAGNLFNLQRRKPKPAEAAVG